MTTKFINPVVEARKSGYSDEEITTYLSNNFPEFEPSIEKAQQAQYNPKEIADYLMGEIAVDQLKQSFPAHAKEMDALRKEGLTGTQIIESFSKKIQKSTEVPSKTKQLGQAFQQLKTDINEGIQNQLIQPFTEGLQESVSGIVTGQHPSLQEQALRQQNPGSFVEDIARSAGGLAGDLPAMTVGGLAGGALGTGIAGPIGGAIGGGAAAFATPTLIKSGFREYKELVANNEKLSDLSMGEVLESIGDIAKDTSISGATGALVALNPYLGVLKKIPVGNKLLNAKVLGKALKFGTELASLETVPSIQRGELPSPTELAKSAIVLTGFKFSKATGQKLLQFAKKVKMKRAPFEKLLEGLSEGEIDKISAAKNLGQVEEILAMKAKRIQEPSQKPLQPLAAKVEPFEKIPVQKILKQAPETKIVTQAKESKTTFGLKKGNVFAMAKGKPSPGQEPLKPKIGEALTPKTSDIIRNFQKDFNTPIRFGKIAPARKALGIFKSDSGVVRIKSANDVEAASHEVGHVLHSKLWKNTKAMSRDLKPFIKELEPLAIGKKSAQEGFAEFSRMYVTNPNGAQKLAPKFFKYFENTMGEKAPKLKQSLLNARDAYDKFLNASPEGRVFSMIDVQGDKGIVQRTGEWLTQKFSPDKLKTELLDDLFALKRVVADVVGIKPVDVENWRSPLNVYVAARNFKGHVRKGDVFLEHETFDTNLNKIGKPLRKILKPMETREDLNNLRTYLVAKRGLVKNKQGFKTGIRSEDAKAVVKKLGKKYEPVAREIQQYQDTLLKYVKDSGLLSEESFKKIKQANDDYIPFYRVFEADEIASSGSGRKGLEAKVPTKRFKGSTRDIVDPLESIIKNTYTMLEMADRNTVGQQLVKLTYISKDGGKFVEKIPPPLKIEKLSKQEALQSIKRDMKKGKISLSEMEKNLAFYEKTLPQELSVFKPSAHSPMENIISVWFDGKRKFFKVSPEINKVWKEGLSSHDSNILTSIFKIPARTLRAGAILNPRFVQKNFVRDWLGSAVFTKSNLNPIYDPIRGLFSSIKADKTYVEWLKSGGGMATMQSLDRPGSAKRLSQLREDVFFKDISESKTFGEAFKNVLKRGKQVLKHPIEKGLRAASELSEEANRLSEFRKALTQLPKTREGKEFAAFMSRDLSIDFAKIGLKTRALNQIIPFWNATIQGTDKLIRTAMQNPKIAGEAAFRAFVGISLPSLLLQFVNEGDPDIAELQEQEKDFNFITKINGKIIKIPVPFEVGLLFHGLARRSYEYLKENNPKAWEGFANNIIQGTTPGLIPQLALPFAETVANKNFFTGGKIIPRAQEGLISSLQTKTFTSDTAKLIAKGFEYMPKLWKGERAYESKWASPVIIDHFIREWTAGLGAITIQVMDEVLKQSGLGSDIVKPKQSALDRFGFNAFIARYPKASTSSIEQFYDNYFKAKKIKASVKFLSKEGDIKEAQAVYKLDNTPALDDAYKAMSNMQAMVNMIFKDKDMTAEEKREFIDNMYLQMTTFAREANKQVEAFIKRDKK